MTVLDFTVIGKDLTGTTFEKLGASVEGLQAQLTKLDAKRVNIAVNVDDKGAVTRLEATAAGVDNVNRKSAAAAASGGGIGLLGKSLIGIGGVAAVAGIGAVKLALDFESSTAKMAAHAGLTADAAKKIGDAFLSTAGTTKFSAFDMEEAFAAVGVRLSEMQGHALDGTEALQFMRASISATAATGGDLNETTKALATVMQAFGLKTGDAAHAADILTNASHLTSTPIADLSTGIDRLHIKLGPLVPTLGDVSTLVAEMGQHGVTGTKGLNIVTAALQSLIQPSKAGKAALEDLGVAVFDDNGKFVGMEDIIRQLQPKLAGMTDQQRLLTLAHIFGKPAAAAMNQIILEGVDKYKALADKVNEAGTAQKDATAAGQSFASKLGKIKTEFIDTGIVLGQALVPALDKLITKLKPMIDDFAKFVKDHPDLVAAITAVAIATGILTAAIWGTTAAVGALSNAVKFLAANPLVAIGIAIGLVGLKLAENTQQLKDQKKQWWEMTDEQVKAIGRVSIPLGGMIEAVKHSYEQVRINAIASIGQMSKGVDDWFQQTRTNAVAAVGSLANGVGDWFNQTKTNALGSMGQMANGVSDWYNQTKTNAIASIGSLANGVGDWFNQTKTNSIASAGSLTNSVSDWFNQTRVNVVGSIGDMARNVGGWFSSMWGNVTGWANRTWHDVGAAFNGMKDGIRGTMRDMANIAFVDPINFVIDWVIHRGIGDILGAIDHVIGSNWAAGARSVPFMAHFYAAGGTVPGYAPGRDTVPAMLSPGEGILVPEAVKMLGGANAIDKINSMSSSRVGYGGANKSTSNHFAWGGLVPDPSPIMGDIAGGIGKAIDWVQGKLADVAQGILNATIYPMVDRLVTPGIFGHFPADATHKIGQGIVDWLKPQDAAFNASAAASGGYPGVPAASGSALAAQQFAAAHLAQFGWGQEQMGPLIALWNQESGWNANAVNPSSGAYGIPQSLGHGHPYDLGDYANQVMWGLNYIAGRYGSPAAAWGHEQAFNWYSKGGVAPQRFASGGIFGSDTTIRVGDNGPEAVLPLNRPRNLAQLLARVAGTGGESGGGAGSTVEFVGNVDTALATMIMKLIREGKIQIRQSQIVNY